MKNIFLRSFFSFLFLLVSVCIFAQENGHDAIYLRLVKEYTLNTDGSMDYHYIKKQKLLTYRATSNLYGETFVVYDPGPQTLKINDCYTIMANGTKVTAPSNSFNEVLPGFAANAPAYNQLREMVITHTGIERNAVINLDYTIHTGKGYYPAMMANEVLAETEPVQVLIVKVKVPIAVKFIYRLYNSDVNPEYTTEGPYAIYTWMLKDVPAIPPEDFQKGGNELYPRIAFSTSSDRKDVYTKFASQEAFQYRLNDEMKHAVAVVLAENSVKTDILFNLQDDVVNDLRLWPVPLRYAGFKCRTPEMTWNSNGGTLMDKAILLTALLRQAGIPSDPVLVLRQPFFEEKMGTLLDVDDILVKANIIETSPVYLSLNNINSQNLKYSLPGRILVTLNQNEAFPWIKTEEFRSKISYKGNLVINDQEQITGEVSARLFNSCDPWLALLKDKNKAKSFFSGGFSTGDLREAKVFDLNQEETYFSYSVQKDNAFKKDSNFRFFTLPELNNGIAGWGIRLLPAERTTAFEIPYVMEESYEITFVLPFGMTLFNPEENTEIRNAAGDFEYTIKSEQGKVTIKKYLNLPHRLIAPSDYPDFKKLMDHWNSDRYDQLILTRVK